MPPIHIVITMSHSIIHATHLKFLLTDHLLPCLLVLHYILSQIHNVPNDPRIIVTNTSNHNTLPFQVVIMNSLYPHIVCFSTEIPHTFNQSYLIPNGEIDDTLPSLPPWTTHCLLGHMALFTILHASCPSECSTKLINLMYNKWRYWHALHPILGDG